MSVKNVLSEHSYICCGVPQGSILGPLLFLMFINDLPLYTNNVTTDLYADDTTLFGINSSKNVIQASLQKALIQLDTWCKCNGMISNTAKTKVIATAQKRGKLSDDSLDLLFKDVTFQMISYDKILGVYVDNNLTWSFHINFITKNLWLLSRIKEYLSIENRVKFYKSYVQAHLDFCNIIWGNTSQNHL